MTDDYCRDKDGDDSALSGIPETTDLSRGVRGPHLEGMRILRFQRRHEPRWARSTSAGYQKHGRWETTSSLNATGLPTRHSA